LKPGLDLDGWERMNQIEDNYNKFDIQMSGKCPEIS
jgi:archaellum component FlaC